MYSSKVLSLRRSSGLTQDTTNTVKPCRHHVADERLLRAQVEDVELVDPGRHDQQRRRVHALGARRILDQLDEVVLEHDLAGRGGDVAADLEGLHVGLADA